MNSVCYEHDIGQWRIQEGAESAAAPPLFSANFCCFAYFGRFSGAESRNLDSRPTLFTAPGSATVGYHNHSMQDRSFSPNSLAKQLVFIKLTRLYLFSHPVLGVIYLSFLVWNSLSIPCCKIRHACIFKWHTSGRQYAVPVGGAMI